MGVDESPELDELPMTDSNAIQSFQGKLSVLADDTPLAVLPQTLECMPLAMVQAASLIRRRSADNFVADRR